MKYRTKLAVVTTKGQIVFAILYISWAIFSIFFLTWASEMIKVKVVNLIKIFWVDISIWVDICVSSSFFHSKGLLTYCRFDMYWKHSWPWRPPMGLRCYPILDILGWNRAKLSLGWLFCPPEEQSILGNRDEGKSHMLCCKQQRVCGPHGNTSMLFVCNYDNCNLIPKPPVHHLLFR